MIKHVEVQQPNGDVGLFLRHQINSYIEKKNQCMEFSIMAELKVMILIQYKLSTKPAKIISYNLLMLRNGHFQFSDVTEKLKTTPRFYWKQQPCTVVL